MVRWVLDLELLACDFYFVDNVPVEREGAGYKTVPESLMRSIKPKLSLTKEHL
jgi:hypothetical protein